jgi:hypothetical protein
MTAKAPEKTTAPSGGLVVSRHCQYVVGHTPGDILFRNRFVCVFSEIRSGGHQRQLKFPACVLPQHPDY